VDQRGIDEQKRTNLLNCEDDVLNKWLMSVSCDGDAIIHSNTSQLICLCLMGILIIIIGARQ